MTRYTRVNSEEELRSLVSRALLEGRKSALLNIHISVVRDGWVLCKAEGRLDSRLTAVRPDVWARNGDD